MVKCLFLLMPVLFINSVGIAVTKNEYVEKHKYLDSLESNITPDNITKISKLLYDNSTSLGLRYRILIDLANIGTRTSIETITEYENHLVKNEPGFPDIGRNFLPIYHHGNSNGFEIKPLISINYDNKAWSIFVKYDFWGMRQLWLSYDSGDIKSKQPVFLTPLEYDERSIPYYSFDDSQYKLEIDKDSIKFTSRWGFLYLHKKIYKYCIDSLMKDEDSDGIFDINEKLLFLNDKKTDTDEDGIIDGLDKNPLNPNNTRFDKISEIKKAVFNFYFGTTGSKDILITDDESNFDTYAGYIIIDNKKRLYGMLGYTSFSFGKIKFINDCDVIVYLYDYEDPLAAATHKFTLAYKQGRWVIVDFELGLIS